MYNAVRDCSRQNQQANTGHFKAMLQIMNYCVKTPNCGLTLAPNWKWDGKDKNFEFEILGRVDSKYAMDTKTRKSVMGCVTFLEGAPVFRLPFCALLYFSNLDCSFSGCLLLITTSRIFPRWNQIINSMESVSLQTF